MQQIGEFNRAIFKKILQGVGVGGGAMVLNKVDKLEEMTPFL